MFLIMFYILFRKIKQRSLLGKVMTYLNNKYQKYRVLIRTPVRRIDLGHFDTTEEAHAVYLAARDRAMRLCLGYFVRQNRKLLISKMSFVIVNYLSSSSQFETWDVKEEKLVKRKTTRFEKLLKLLSLISYIPSTYSIARYFFDSRKL